MQTGIAGSGKIEGTARTGGAPGTAGIMGDAQPAVKRAMIFWGAAVVILFVFHVGGAHAG